MSTSSPTPFYARALFDYEAVESSELSIRQGDIVSVNEVNESGWCLVHTNEATGWVPTDYIEKIVETEFNVFINTSAVNNVATVDNTNSPSTKPDPVSGTNDAETKAVVPTAVDTSAVNHKRGASLTVTPAIIIRQQEQKQQPTQPRNSDINNTINIPASLPAQSTKSCSECSQPILSAFISAKSRHFHPQCFKCHTCQKSLAGQPYLERDCVFYCEADFYAAFNPRCARCHVVITGKYITALNQAWHQDHFTCAHCQQPFTGDQFRKRDDKPYCQHCYDSLFGTKCCSCDQMITGEIFQALEKEWHPECFKCNHPSAHVIDSAAPFHVKDGKVYCVSHFEQLFLEKCHTCNKVIDGQFLKVLDLTFHPHCWKCMKCASMLSSENCIQGKDKELYCRQCEGTANNAAPATSATTSVSPNTTTSTFVKQPTPDEALTPMLAATRIIKPAVQYSPSAASEASQTVSPVKSTYSDPSNTILSYAELIKTRSGHVNPAAREQYLSEGEFKTVFGMDKGQFNKLADWKKAALKKEKGLF